MSRLERVVLQGGSRDGDFVDVWSWQQVVYLPKKISRQEVCELRVDEVIAWKHPEDVYVRGKDGFSFQKTVHYKPGAKQ